MTQYSILEIKTPENVFDGFVLQLPEHEPVWKLHAFLGLICEAVEYELPKKHVFSLRQKLVTWLMKKTRLTISCKLYKLIFNEQPKEPKLNHATVKIRVTLQNLMNKA